MRTYFDNQPSKYLHFFPIDFEYVNGFSFKIVSNLISGGNVEENEKVEENI